jgi:hypothetical protein
MDQAGSDYVLAVRVLHAGSIIMTHAVEGVEEAKKTLCSLPPRQPVEPRWLSATHGVPRGPAQPHFLDPVVDLVQQGPGGRGWQQPGVAQVLVGLAPSER